ncbi:MAG: YebC/PmpR family DNA-binding transcriptional regulator [candidate division Zixibacteria bacterium]|nr:YebC/PmpR family DNA-binding transcriptional regulator [candidate division Zixibacteria bacterium]
MSGHSKWATIKRKKGKTDAARGRIFTRLIKEITIAARDGGGDPEINPRLRTAIATSKGANMPQENIKKAIQKGTGELPGVSYDEATYEGYGPAGVAILIDTLTDNKNRTVAEIRHLFMKHNGNLGENGCVSWMFDKKGIITVNRDGVDEDTFMEAALEAGASDIESQEDAFEVSTEPHELETVRGELEKGGFTILEAEVQRIPQNTVKLNEKQAESMMKLMDAIEDQDDVQLVSANFDIDDEILEKLSGE